MKKYQSELEWKKFLKAAQQLGCVRQAVFILALAARSFHFSFPSAIKRLSHGVIFFKLLQYHSVPRIMNFPPTQQWWHPNNPTSKKMHEECALTFQLLQEEKGVQIALRPRRLFFFFKLWRSSNTKT
jgi:hypothetical protein